MKNKSLLAVFIGLSAHGLSACFNAVNLCRQIAVSLDIPAILDCDYKIRSIRSGLRMANKRNAHYAVIVGDDEVKANKLRVKCMSNGQEELIPNTEAELKLWLQEAF